MACNPNTNTSISKNQSIVEVWRMPWTFYPLLTTLAVHFRFIFEDLKHRQIIIFFYLGNFFLFLSRALCQLTSEVLVCLATVALLLDEVTCFAADVSCSCCSWKQKPVPRCALHASRLCRSHRSVDRTRSCCCAVRRAGDVIVGRCSLDPVHVTKLLNHRSLLGFVAEWVVYVAFVVGSNLYIVCVTVGSAWLFWFYFKRGVAHSSKLSLRTMNICVRMSTWGQFFTL